MNVETARGHHAGVSTYTLANEEQTHEAIRWVLAARVIQLQANGLDLNATLPGPLYEVALDSLVTQWSGTPANGSNKRRHGETSPMAPIKQTRHDVKSRFKAWARMVYGDIIFLQSILLTGLCSPEHVAAVAKVQASHRAQTNYAQTVAPDSEARTHQKNRKMMKWLENQMQARGLPVPTDADPTQVATGSAPTCSQCRSISSSECITCHRPLCNQCCRGNRCINVGNCKNYIDPPATKGKGKGKAKGMSNRELVEQYRVYVARVAEYVDKTGRGRRADGTWGASAHAALGAMWLTTPEYRARGQCYCGWQSDELWRCSFCHVELCMWHARWEGRVCHCSEGCRQHGHAG